MIECKIYTTKTREWVVKPSQSKDDARIKLFWNCPSCGRTLLRCICIDEFGNQTPDASWADAWREQQDRSWCPVCGHSMPYCTCKR